MNRCVNPKCLDGRVEVRLAPAGDFTGTARLCCGTCHGFGRGQGGPAMNAQDLEPGYATAGAGEGKPCGASQDRTAYPASSRTPAGLPCA